MPQRDIKVGDVVRSYDFPDSQDSCYVVGQVTAIGPVPNFECPRYTVRVIHRVWLGEIEAPREDDSECVYPPVNGTRKLMGGICNGVTPFWTLPVTL